jgi:hypothetical protein
LSAVAGFGGLIAIVLTVVALLVFLGTFLSNLIR